MLVELKEQSRLSWESGLARQILGSRQKEEIFCGWLNDHKTHMKPLLCHFRKAEEVEKKAFEKKTKNSLFDICGNC